MFVLNALDEEIIRCRDALNLQPKERAEALHSLAYSLYDRFCGRGEMADLNEALALHREALSLRPEGHPHREITLGEIAICLHTRFNHLGSLSDLEEALALQRDALKFQPEGHPNRDFALSNMAGYLNTRFKEFGMISDFDEAFALEQIALELRIKDHPYRGYSLGNFAWFNYVRFEQLGTLSYIDEALALEREALELRPPGHPYRSFSLQHISTYLRSRFKQGGTRSDLDEALAFQRSALEDCFPRDPNRPIFLSGVASALFDRFRLLGAMSDLDEALALHHDALASRPQGHHDRPDTLRSIADCLYARFGRLGTLVDLEEALSLQRSALGLLPQRHPSRRGLLREMASCFHARFVQFKTLPDLDNALALGRDALELLPPRHTSRTVVLNDLAMYLYNRFTELKVLSDLEEAIALVRNALELISEGHIHRSHILSNIACYLHCRYVELGAMSDLEEVLSLARAALEHASLDGPDRAKALSNAAYYIYFRFIELGTVSDLDEAIVLEQEALTLRPKGDPYRSTSLGYLAHRLRVRCERVDTQDLSGLQDCFSLYSQLSEISQTVSFQDLKWIKEWIQAAETYKHDTTVLAYRTFLRLCIQHFSSLPTLPQHLALLKQLMTSEPADAFSACVRYGNSTDAVELLEQGRGVFWNQLLRLRSDLDDVIASGTGKELADRFTRLASLLSTALGSTPSAQSQHEEAHHLQIQLQEIVADIRRLPGLARFLLPPLFADLQTAAAGGPVIIVNASRYSCDAVIVLSDQDPIHVALPVTRARVHELLSELRVLLARARFDDASRNLMGFLRELWDLIVSPIVKSLEKVCPHRSRIWWCPTAEFSLLPLHAAGAYRKGQPNLSGLYISSYTPTLAALIRARRQRQMNEPLERPRCLLVGQANAQGEKKLVSVNTELSSISQRIESVASVTCIRDQAADIANVSEKLGKSHFVHLACHGIPNRRNPFESGFALGDGLLKIGDIMWYHLHDAQFAYLSACHTTVGDDKNPDEVIHLAAAMQFAGFRSVIGTMWAVDDAHTNEITSKFYEYMVDGSGRLDHARAAWALHNTMRTVSKELPLDQRILYVHIGA